jgi:hypothetical protein
MPEPRRQLRSLPEAGGPYFDERLWPVLLALIAFGSLLVAISWRFLPHEGVPWYRSAWPSLIGVPVLVVVAMVLLATIDSRMVRRSVQLALVLCAMFHVVLAVQMMQTRVLVGPIDRPEPKQLVRERPPKLVPHYHPTQLLPDEDRPRQDFERPIESQSPVPTDQAEQVVRQPTEEDHSPSEPQPVPTPEQQLTIEPNVIERAQPNEAVPRLAPQTSQLSRQVQPTESKASELVALPEAARPQTPEVELAPSDAASTAAAKAEAIAESRAAAELSRLKDSASLDRSRADDAAALTELPAARRAEATQRTPSADAAAPLAPARLARSRAGAQIPTAAIRAEPLPSANTPAAQRIAEITASSSSALTRANASAKSDAITAARGAGEIDLGDAPTVVPSRIGKAKDTDRIAAVAPRPTQPRVTAERTPLAIASPAAAPEAAVDLPEIGAASPSATTADALAPQPARVSIARSARPSRDALTIDVPEPAGPSGLGSEFTPDVGTRARQARADSINLELRTARFIRRDIGGLPAMSTAAVVATEAFSSRSARVRGEERAGGSGTPLPVADEAIERGLAFLARYQQPDGSWTLQGFPEGASLVSNTAATSLAVIAFQGAGYNHREFQYKDVLRGGLSYLLVHQKADGDLYLPLDAESSRSVWLYSHSLAAIALCEAYGMTQDPALREPAQRALDFIVASQHPERGGWRYAPGVSADTSVSGWMLMAMKSGELAGLTVPPSAYDAIRRWLDTAQQSPTEAYLYRYNPYAPDSPEQRHGRVASKTMTAVGLLMRLYTGWDKDDERLLRGASYLALHPPTVGTQQEQERDTYYWYYATLFLANVGGERWQTWNARLTPLLVESQIRRGAYAGSWDPQLPLPDRWAGQAGRLYVTALNLLSLEVQNRKLRVR